MKYLLALIFSLFPIVTFAGPVWPTRGFLMQPKWTGKVDTNSVFDHGGYWANVARGFNSDSDRWAWDISMGAIFEFARWGDDKALVAFTGMELTADLNDAIAFRPRGAFWHEGIFFAEQSSNTFEWQAGTIYTCRHDIDNGDPGQYSDVFGERTLIYCSLSGKAIWNTDKLLGLNSPTTAWLHGDFYLIGEDYRLPRYEQGVGTDFQAIQWSVGPAFQSKFAQWERSSLYLEANANYTAFGKDTLNRFKAIKQITVDAHTELGYEIHGRAARIQFYLGWDQWQDDGAVPIPRNAQYVSIGVRTTGTDLVSF